MKLLSTSLLIFILVLSARISVAQSDTTFFDADWHKTTREHASFYRPLPRPVSGGLYEVHDHFINNNTQMNSFIPDPSSDKLEGQTFFYDNTGHKEGEGMYKDGKKTGSWKFYYFGCDRLKSMQSFRNDSVIGKAVFYDSATGKKSSEGNFYGTDKREGEWLFYFRDQIIRKENYTDSISTFINFDSTTFLMHDAGGYKNNKEEGAWTAYKPSTGKIYGIRHYKNGTLNGELKLYDTTTGNVLVEGMFLNGEKSGTWITYRHSGSILSTDSIIPSKLQITKYYDSTTGKLSILARKNLQSDTIHVTVYFPGTDIIAEERETSISKATGPATYYDLESKRKRSEGVYRDGKYTGVWTFYFRKTGKLKSTETYEEGNLQGRAIYYDSLTGKKIADAWFTENKRDSVWKRYYPATGKLQVTETYRNGKYDGERIVYYASGKILSRGNYTEGAKNGQWIQYYESIDIPESKTQYKNGIKDGAQADYYMDGKIKRQESYTDGKMTEGKFYLQDGKEAPYFPHYTSPSFPGDLDMYTETYLQYPHPAQVAHREGTVRVSFKVDTDGTLSDIKIINGIGGMCDEAVVAFLSDMPKWNPARLEGKARSANTVLLVKFKAATGSTHVTPVESNEE